jgi:hypothetical protein
LFPFHVLKILWLLTYSAFVKRLTTKTEVAVNTVLKRVTKHEERKLMKGRYGNNCIIRDSLIGTHFNGIEE